MATEKHAYSGLQGLVAFLGITLGVVPLVTVALGGEVGRLLSWAPGTGTDPGRWLLPAGVVVAAVAVVGLLEALGLRSARRG